MGARARGLRVAAGIAVALLMAPFVDGVPQASAGRSRSGLRVLSVHADSLVDVPLNFVVQIRFDQRVTKSSLTNGSISIRPVVDGVVGEPRPGELRRRGNVVRFIPTLPTHAIDPDDPGEDFHPPGSPRDDAFENGSFRVGTTYRVVVSGRGDKPAARSVSGQIVRRTATAEFRTFEETREEPVFFSEFEERPSLRVLSTNPPDGVLSVHRDYTDVDGTPSVPTDAHVTVFCSGVPFDPVTLREPGAVQLLRVAPLEVGEDPELVAGDVVVEQDRTRANLTFRPAEPLQELSTYALRIADSVQDLTETVTLEAHDERTRLWRIHRSLDSARRLNPGIPVEFLPDPPRSLIAAPSMRVLDLDQFDLLSYEYWPDDHEARGVLKANILDAGDNRPWTIDPRVFAVFTTRDEAPVASSPDDVAAKSPADRRGALATITRIVTPLGLVGGGWLPRIRGPHQDFFFPDIGYVGAGMWRRGSNVTLPFLLADRRGRPAVVEAQWGVDFDSSGVIDEFEFRPLTATPKSTEVSGAVTDTPSARGWKFATSPGLGRSNALVWDSYEDLGGAVYRTFDYLYTEHGRNIADPNHPGSELFDSPTAGVVVRMRTTRGKRRASDWVYTRPFELSNASAPSLTIDRVDPGDPVTIEWTAFDRDSEDTDGNGVLDFIEGEDRNGNGVPDLASVSVAFDFFTLADGQEPSAFSADELAGLDWQPCTREPSAGDPDIDLPASPAGYPYAFAWDAGADGLIAGDRVIVRARPIDDTRTPGTWVYSTDVVTIVD